MTSAFASNMAGICPRCARKLGGHAYQLFATVVADTENESQLLDFIRLVKENNWQKLSGKVEFDGSKNALHLIALRCEDGSLTELFVRDPHELWECRSIEDWDALEEQESRRWSLHLSRAEWSLFT
jgi:hypothetical protein